MIKIIKVSLSSLCIGLCLLSNAANAGKLYKWVDAKGVVSYQDQPPPKGSKIISEKDVKSSAALNADKKVINNQSLRSVTIYTVKDCELCEHFVTLMRKNKVPHIERSLEGDRAAQSKILNELGSLRAPSILIGDNVFQNKSLSDFRSVLLEQGYDIGVVEETPSESIKNPNKNSNETDLTQN